MQKSGAITLLDAVVKIGGRIYTEACEASGRLNKSPDGISKAELEKAMATSMKELRVIEDIINAAYSGKKAKEVMASIRGVGARVYMDSSGA